MSEAPRHPHLAARGTFTESESGGAVQPAPAPRFTADASGPVGALPAGAVARPGAHTRDVLADLGFADAEDLLSEGAVRQA
jgi:alpha-methylacyl-CoA racemase